ncbi:MAG: hypothetical protein CV087_23310 [Candidatus Brocadia sp. WS118]|nr:MAG: hypothetical protein CV087_23310 [Candidatus Brocadia sp. WS118]
MNEVGQIANFACPDCLSNMEIIKQDVTEQKVNFGEGIERWTKIRTTARCTKEDCSRLYSEDDFT